MPQVVLEERFAPNFFAVSQSDRMKTHKAGTGDHVTKICGRNLPISEQQFEILLEKEPGPYCAIDFYANREI